MFFLNKDFQGTDFCSSDFSKIYLAYLYIAKSRYLNLLLLPKDTWSPFQSFAVIASEYFKKGMMKSSSKLNASVLPGCILCHGYSEWLL